MCATTVGLSSRVASAEYGQVDLVVSSMANLGRLLLPLLLPLLLLVTLHHDGHHGGSADKDVAFRPSENEDEDVDSKLCYSKGDHHSPCLTIIFITTIMMQLKRLSIREGAS